MPLYEYLCAENGAVIEVLHAPGRILSTWRELCAADGCELGVTPPDAPVVRLFRGRIFVTGNIEDHSKGKVTWSPARRPEQNTSKNS